MQSSKSVLYPLMTTLCASTLLLGACAKSIPTPRERGAADRTTASSLGSRPTPRLRPAASFIAPKTASTPPASRSSASDPVSEALVKRLVKVGQPGLGYSGSVAGTQFLPLQGTGRVGIVLLGRQPPRRSALLTKLVARGLRALPTLLRHLGNGQPIALPPLKAMMWMSRTPRVDYNHRTEKPTLAIPSQAGLPVRPRLYNVTVGDLCYVAVGQIVNRDYTAVRYQPTGGLVVNSPPGDPKLLAAVRKQWRGLTKSAHRKLLARDFGGGGEVLLPS